MGDQFYSGYVKFKKFATLSPDTETRKQQQNQINEVWKAYGKKFIYPRESAIREFEQLDSSLTWGYAKDTFSSLKNGTLDTDKCLIISYWLVYKDWQSNRKWDIFEKILPHIELSTVCESLALDDLFDEQIIQKENDSEKSPDKEHKPIIKVRDETLSSLHTGQILSKIEDIKFSFQNSIADKPWQPELLLPNIPLRKDKANWLSPYVSDSLPFFGRKAELAQLTEFLRATGGGKRTFLIWALSGPSGSGKTRMIVHWMRGLQKSNPNANIGFLNETDVKDWSNWQPDRPTFIVIDYIYKYKNTIKAIVEQCEKLIRRNQLSFPVNLLLIDHIFPEKLDSLLDRPFYRAIFENNPELYNGNESVFFKDEPLHLKKEEFHQRSQDSKKQICNPSVSEENLILSIIKATPAIFGKSINEQSERKIYNRLRELKALHPLFAALMTQTLIDKPEADFSNRRALIEQYIKGRNNRAPWDIDKKLGDWVGCYVSVATIRKGALFELLRPCLPNNEPYWIRQSDTDVRTIENMSCQVVADYNENRLSPYEPDIIGESFFLFFLREKRGNNLVHNSLVSMVCQGNELQQDRAGAELIGFVERLVRNLCNEDQSDEDTCNYWDFLIKFLHPQNFSESEAISICTSVALMKAYLIVANRELIKYTGRLQELIATNEFQNLKNINLITIATDTFLKYYNALSPNNISEGMRENLLSLLDLFDTYKIQHGYSSLALVCQYELPDLASSLISKGMEVNEAIGEGAFTPLMKTCFNNNVKTLQILIEAGADLNIRTDYGFTALMFAASSGHLEIVKALIEAEVDIEFEGKKGETALVIASQCGHNDVVIELLKAGADIDKTNGYGQTAIMHACMTGKLETVLLLLKYKPNLDIVNDAGWTALMAACSINNAEIVKALISAGADANIINKDSTTALHWACYSGYIDVVKELVNADINIDYAAEDGHTALMAACVGGHQDIVDVLIKAEAKIELTDDEGTNALKMAAHNGNEAIARLLIKSGVDINCTDNFEQTALMAACDNGNRQFAEVLIENNADINQLDVRGYTALIYASQKGHKDIVQMLLNSKAEVHHEGDNIWTALMCAQFRGDDEMAQILIEAGAKY